MSGDYLCEFCGGHGAVMVFDPTARHEWRSEPCRLCDGQDRVTPLIESWAEQDES